MTMVRLLGSAWQEPGAASLSSGSMQEDETGLARASLDAWELEKALQRGRHSMLGNEVLVQARRTRLVAEGAVLKALHLQVRTFSSLRRRQS